MLTKEDLQAIQEIVDKTIDQKVPGIVSEEVNRQLSLTMENLVLPQLKALAEGQQLLLETLAPKNKVEAMEEEIELLKSVVRMHSREIEELKKAQ